MLPLRHLHVATVEGSGQWVLALLALDVDICHQLLLAGEDDLGFVGEVDLHNLVAESEHDRVASLHPLLHVTERTLALLVIIGLGLDLAVGVEIVAEMLQQRHLLLEFAFLGKVLQRVGGHGVDLLVGLLLDVVKIPELNEEVLSLGVKDDLGRVVEVDACGAVREQVAQAVLGRVVHPLLDVQLRGNVVVIHLFLLDDALHRLQVRVVAAGHHLNRL